MRKDYKIAIIGGGASGIMCATELIRGEGAINSDDIVILERNDRVLKKLIVTGNGQCNLTNENFSENNYYGDKNFIKEFVSELNNKDLEDYFYGLGLPLYTAVDGKKYPLSRQANAVVDLLREFLEQRKVEIATNFFVKKVSKDAGGDFLISNGEEEIKAKIIVLATGGAVAKQYGTDGFGYRLAEAFGHTCTKIFPSLVQLKTDTSLIRALKGLKEQVKATALDGERELKSQVGEVLFTEYGVSGPAIFQISGHLSTAKNPKVRLEFLPQLSSEELEKILLEREKIKPFSNSLDYLNGLINKRVGQVIMKTAEKVNPKSVTSAVKNFTLKVIGNLGFDNAQVTKGGIDTDKVSAKTFESKITDNLFLTGEMLNVDGDCGGYNLSFAFSSGILSARAIKKKCYN